MVYFIEAIGSGSVKIGTTKVGVDARLKGLETGCPHDLRVIATINGDEFVEKKIHAWLARHRLRGEWFRLNHDVRAAIAMIVRRERKFSENSPIDNSIHPEASLAGAPL